MKNTKRHRVFIILGVFGVICGIFVFRLVKLQLIDGSAYYDQSKRSVVTTNVVKAARGDILDRNCRPLVENKKTVSVIINRSVTEDLNDTIKNLIKIFETSGDSYINTFPISETEPFYFQEDYEITPKFKAYLTNKNITVQAPPEIMSELIKYYNLSSYEPSYVAKIVAVRYEVEQRMQKSFFTFAQDVGTTTATMIKENNDKLLGVYLEVEPTRIYTHEYFASHILGTVGRIYAEEYDDLKSQGYMMDDFVGKDGIEKICEPYLKGTNGLKSTVRDDTGTVVDVIQNQDAQAGNDVILTIDQNMQKITEDGLSKLIGEYRTLNGETAAKSAAAVFMRVGTGEVLSMASWPTYNLATYNTDFSTLSKDPAKPFVNRAISGTFPPGSTMKMMTAIAGLETGVINLNSTRTCTGLYTFFPTYHPSCFNKTSHGTVNVVSALKKSCNVFFFDVGRLVGIDTLNQYGKMLGFGEKTGIELVGESAGILAGKESREKMGGTWEAGETILAAVGQTDNAATPLQLANYAATIASQGKRYTPHIIKSIRDKQTGEIIKDTEQSFVDLGISKKTIDIITDGMVEVAKTGGSAGGGFKDFTLTSVAVKTGTSEMPRGLPTSLIVGFAPAENPQIAFSIVVENGGALTTGINSALVKDVISYYLTNISDNSVTNENELLK